MNAATQSSHPEQRVISQNVYQYDQSQPNIVAPPPYSRYPWDIPHPVPSGPSVPTGPGAALTRYNSPPANVEGDTSVEQQQQQPQHRGVVVLSFVRSRFVIIRPGLSFAAHRYLSCFVMWWINPLFGVIAYMLAVSATNKAATDPQAARKLGRASYGVSFLGFVVTAVVVTLVVVLSLPRSCGPGYLYNNICYKYKTSDWSPSSECTDYYFGTYDSFTGNCYYNDRTTTLANSPMVGLCSSPNIYYHDGKCYKYRTLSSDCYYGTYDSSTGYCYTDYTTPAPTTAPKQCWYSSYSYKYYYNGVCYKYRLSYQSSSSCSFGMYDSANNYCYYS